MTTSKPIRLISRSVPRFITIMLARYGMSIGVYHKDSSVKMNGGKNGSSNY
jgi:uncharacterized protein YacL